MTENLRPKKVLVHVCCAPCASYSMEKLINDGYSVTAYFYNPNIHPEEEYKARLDDLIQFAKKLEYQLITEEDPPKTWFDAVKGYEREPEGGKRCEICFRVRLEKAAILAKKNGYDAFTTVLTISPHKNSKIINQIGKEIAEKYGVEFIEENFKKKEGFKKSIELSKKYNLYRQNYCGCVYSEKNRN